MVLTVVVCWCTVRINQYDDHVFQETDTAVTQLVFPMCFKRKILKEVKKILEFLSVQKKGSWSNLFVPFIISGVHGLVSTVVSRRPEGSSMIEITCQLLFTVTDVLPPNLLKTPQHPPTY